MRASAKPGASQLAVRLDAPVNVTIVDDAVYVDGQHVAKPNPLDVTDG